VEPANRTHTEEFYEVNPCSLSIAELNRQLQAWEPVAAAGIAVQDQQLVPNEFTAKAGQDRWTAH
jgi:hypothetical protein